MAEAVVDVNSEFINQYVLASENSTEGALKNLVHESEVPRWLKKELLQDTLRKHLNNPRIVVKKLKILFCGGKGDNFASVMYRVPTYYYDQKYPEMVKCMSCILKTIPETEIFMTNLGSDNYDVQNKEMFFYEKLIPEFEAILKRIGEDGKTFPTVMAVYRDLNLIVMEDLMELDYQMQNRLEGLDAVHTKETLKTLAKMHAASAVLYQSDPKIFKHMDTGFYTRKTDVFQIFFMSNLEVFTDAVASWSDWKDCDYYTEKLLKLRKSFIENCRLSFDCDESDFNCLTHGDLWTNNVLFRYEDDDTPASTVVLDFQYYFYGSPTLDLIYFLYTSIYDKMRMENMEELVQFYYYELKDLLQRLKYDMKKFPSLHKFQIQMLKKSFYALSVCCVTLPVMISQDDEADFEALMSRDERAMGFKNRIYKNPRFKQIAMDMLPVFDRKGILDEC